MTPTAAPIDPDRLWRDVMSLAAITDESRPFTRRSFSPKFLEGRDFLRRSFEAAGLSVAIDAAGNLIGRRNGRAPEAGVVMIGSHSDTVPSGGRFDGIAGVAAALEIARALADAGIDLRHSLEIVDFLAEEPSEFGLSCVGSRGMAGKLGEAQLAMTDPNGETLGAAMRRVGGAPERLSQNVRTDVRAFFELHIEQGPVLEARGVDVGIVTGIVGITRLEIVFAGAADHAGTAPMDLRRDALVAAAETIGAIRREACLLAAEGDGYFVATVGVADIEPGAANVVPARARIVVDARTSRRPLVERFLAAIERASGAAALAARVERQRFSVLSDTAPVDCDVRLRGLIERGAAASSLSSMRLASGAGHDAAFIATIAPVAMAFIPCREGRSHAPEEWAEPTALANGAAAILDAVRRFDVGES